MYFITDFLTKIHNTILFLFSVILRDSSPDTTKEEFIYVILWLWSEPCDVSYIKYS